MQNVKPSGDRLIVLPMPAEEVTRGGIIIPEAAKEKPSRGTIVAAGPGLKGEEMPYKDGDKVLYSKYAGTEFIYNDQPHLILRVADIFATFEEEPINVS